MTIEIFSAQVEVTVLRCRHFENPTKMILESLLQLFSLHVDRLIVQLSIIRKYTNCEKRAGNKKLRRNVIIVIKHVFSENK